MYPEDSTAHPIDQSLFLVVLLNDRMYEEEYWNLGMLKKEVCDLFFGY